MESHLKALRENLPLAWQFGQSKPCFAFFLCFPSQAECSPLSRTLFSPLRRNSPPSSASHPLLISKYQEMDQEMATEVFYIPLTILQAAPWQQPSFHEQTHCQGTKKTNDPANHPTDLLIPSQFHVILVAEKAASLKEQGVVEASVRPQFLCSLFLSLYINSPMRGSFLGWQHWDLIRLKVSHSIPFCKSSCWGKAEVNPRACPIELP